MTGYIVATTLIILGISIIHEILHIYVAQSLGVKTSLSIKKSFGIPYAIAVNLEGFEGKYRELTNSKKKDYNTIAIAPYIYIIPLCVFLVLTGNQLLTLTSLGIQVWHIINYPLEWII